MMRWSDHGGAVFSDCGRYRYLLWRDLNEAPLFVVEPTRVLLWVMLNPSTADEVEEDPTIRRCIAFGRHWGFHRLEVCNLFGLRATDPSAMLMADDPLGPENDTHLHLALGRAERVIVGWGTHGNHLGRADLFAERYGAMDRLECLGVNKAGSPKHPLYVSGDTEPKPWPSPSQSIPSA